MASHASHVPPARPVWWPTAGDLGAMVGLARCDGRGEPEPCTGDVRDREDPDDEDPGPTALAARLSGLLRAGC